MAKILCISGSLRKASFNTALSQACVDLVPEGTEWQVATLHGIPLYDGDVEASEGSPKAVADLKTKVIACDGLVLCTPEYNNGVPGVFKNGIDWLSRPSADIAKVFGGRPVALMGASPGPFGTILSQEHWLTTLRTLGTRPWFGQKMLVSHANTLFDDAGQLSDTETRERLKKYLHGFVEFVNKR